MNNFLEYFYQIKVDNIKHNHNNFSFTYKNNNYKLYIYDDNLNIELLYNICLRLSNNTLISQIIKNRNQELITTYNNLAYILVKIYANPNKEITLEELTYLNKQLYTSKLKVNWANLWSNKIDYLEELINENGKKYPLLVDSFNYFVGLTENAISYYNNIIIDESYKLYLTHKHIKINDTIEDIYNPLNIIFDYQVRDIAEYIKRSFFINNNLIIKELTEYLSTNNLSLTDIKLLVARLLYPSFYFELYEDILLDNQDEIIISKITSRIDEYEKYISSIINYLKKYYDIETIKWLEKKEDILL